MPHIGQNSGLIGVYRETSESWSYNVGVQVRRLVGSEESSSLVIHVIAHCAYHIRLTYGSCLFGNQVVLSIFSHIFNSWLLLIQIFFSSFLFVGRP